MNKVILTGNLTKEVELKYTQAGKAVGTFSLAVKRDYKNAEGNYDADFLSCKVWGKSAEILANYTQKGSKILTEGRVETRNYEKDGKKVYVTEVVVDRFEFLDNKANGEKKDAPKQKNDDPFANAGKEVNVSDDDLPF